MNRLIVTLMLIMAMALGLTRLAHAGTPAAPTVAAKVPVAKEAPPATIATPVVQDADFTDTVDDITVHTVIKDGSVTRTASTTSDSCSECSHIELKPLDSSLASTLPAKKSIKEIQDFLHDTTKIDATAAVEKEEKRQELQDKLDKKIAQCEVAPESKVEMKGDRPRMVLVQWDSRKSDKQSSHVRSPKKEDKDEYSDDDDAASQLTFDTPADDTDHEVFTAKDQCLAEKLGENPEPSVKNALISSSFDEYLKLDAKMQSNQLTPKEALRYQALGKYLGTLASDPKYAGIVQAVMYQKALAMDQALHQAATQAGSSPQLAAQLRQPGGALSDGMIANFKTLLNIGRVASGVTGDVATFSQFKVTDLQKLTTQIDKDSSKTTTNSTGNSYLDAYKQGGGVDDNYDKALKESTRIARAAGMGDLTGNLDEREPGTMKGSSAIARLVPRNSSTTNIPCMNANAYSPTLNTGNSVANAVPQACQLSNGTTLASQQQLGASSNANNSSFHIYNRTP